MSLATALCCYFIRKCLYVEKERVRTDATVGSLFYCSSAQYNTHSQLNKTVFTMFPFDKEWVSPTPTCRKGLLSLPTVPLLSLDLFEYDE